MLITTTEGQGWLYEVIVQSDGYLVQARDLDTGKLAEDGTTLFRTVPAALAFADMAAAADRYAAARLDCFDQEETALEFERECDRFAAVRLRLSDEGISSEILVQRRDSAVVLSKTCFH
jgi:hypothetical protein